jgi:hypothetical protein
MPRNKLHSHTQFSTDFCKICTKISEKDYILWIQAVLVDLKFYADVNLYISSILFYIYPLYYNSQLTYILIAIILYISLNKKISVPKYYVIFYNFFLIRNIKFQKNLLISLKDISLLHVRFTLPWKCTYSELLIWDNLRTRSKGEQSTLFLLHKEIVIFESSQSEFSISLMQEE